jgi:hypothetical protein
MGPTNGANTTTARDREPLLVLRLSRGGNHLDRFHQAFTGTGLVH